MSRLAISCPHSERPDAVRELTERLRASLPGWTIVDDPPGPGEALSEDRKAAIETAAVVLAVIGPQWLASLPGRSRSAAADPVGAELRHALDSGCLVVPVPVLGAQVPNAAALADYPELVALPSLPARPVRPGPDFEGDFERLIAFVQRLGPRVDVGTVLGGKYRLTRTLGDGGPGAVYQAEQLLPPRPVAVKLVVQPGLPTEVVLARFDAQRRILATLDHPNIAGTFDAGRTACGRAYFVADLVDWVPLTDYCDAERLAADARLALFLRACDAVHHAHTQGIVHGDLRPTNVLVAAVAGKPVLKVIDFGLAAAVDGRPSRDRLDGQFRRTVWRWLYAAPERWAGLDADARTDVYSLGVLLHELFLGPPPLPRAARAAGGDQSADGTGAPSRAAGHPPGLRGLAATARGEIGRVAAKATEDDIARRYPTAEALADDVRRFFNHARASADRPAPFARLRKFVRRRLAPVVGAVATALVVR